jgi:AraC-like DNA-binding protein
VREFPPPAALAPYVECFWSRSPSEPDGTHRVLPDGCLDIIFSERGAVVVGAMTRPLLIPSRAAVSLLGVRFLPGMATAFLHVPAAEVTDGNVPLDAVWRDGEQVSDQVGSALDSPLGVTRLSEVLLARLAATRPIPADVRTAVSRIVSRGGRSGVSDVASSIGVSRQHLARRFADYVGVSPKMLSRVMRLRDALRVARAVRGPGRINWAALAADHGYSDQSHLVAEFRSLTGLTPSRWASGSKSPIARAAAAVS